MSRAVQMCPRCSADNAEGDRYCAECGAELRRLLGRGVVLARRYRVERVLGCGGFGAVYAAADLRLSDATVAVKENLVIEAEATQQFENEARILAGLRHPSLPRVTDYFVSSRGRQVLVMDFVEGRDLHDMVTADGPVDVDKGRRWLTHVLDAVEYLHSQSPPIIHRDIKPRNVRIASDGRAMLVDFGIAKRWRSGQDTMVGARAVSPGFSPIEQYGAGGTDARSDIYGIGATFYFAFTGLTPPEATERVAADGLLPPSQQNAAIDSALDRAVTVALAVGADDRWQSARDFALALSDHTGHPVPPRTGRLAADRKAPNPWGDAPVAPYASGVRRLNAALIDLMLVGLLAFLFDGLRSVIAGWQHGPSPYQLISGSFLYSWAAVQLAYHTAWTWATGQTIGKQLMSIKVVDARGQRVPLWKAAVRSLLLIGGLIACCAFPVAVLSLLDEDHQGFHDKATGSFVIRCDL